MTRGILSEMTLEEVRAFQPEVVVLPVGSTEPHGPALPYGTDTWQIEALCRQGVVRANDHGARVLLYPTLPIGNNVNFKAFPFACRIGVRTLMRILRDIIQAIEEEGVRKIVLACGHGGNTDTLRATLREHFDQTPPDRRAFVTMRMPGLTDDIRARHIRHESNHGGESETSQMMHLRPDLVRTDRLENMPFGAVTIQPLLRDEMYFVRPWHLHVPRGAGGVVTDASAEKGEALLDAESERFAALLTELSEAPWHVDFPYAPKQ